MVLSTGDAFWSGILGWEALLELKSVWRPHLSWQCRIRKAGMIWSGNESGHSMRSHDFSSVLYCFILSSWHSHAMSDESYCFVAPPGTTLIAPLRSFHGRLREPGAFKSRMRPTAGTAMVYGGTRG